MSVAQVHTVHRANKDQGKCEHCGALLPKGSAYRWYQVGFRSHFKHRRCMLPGCTPKPSERESSLLSSVMAASENAESQLARIGADYGASPDDVVSDIQTTLAEVADAADDVVQQYRDQDEQFGGGGNTDSAERADTLEEAASELRDWQPPQDAPEGCEEHDDDWQAEGCDACQQHKEDWLLDVVAEAEAALAEVGV